MCNDNQISAFVKNNYVVGQGNRGPDQILDTINTRLQWEKNFDNRYIKPTLDQKVIMCLED